MQGHSHGHTNSGGTFQSALEENRRKAGIKTPPPNRPSPTGSTPNNNSSQPTEESASQPNRGGGIWHRFMNSTFRTKMIIGMSIAGGIVMLYQNAITSTSPNQQTEVDEAADDPMQAIKQAAINATGGIGESQGTNTQAKPVPGQGKPQAETEICDPQEQLKTMGTQWLPKESYVGGATMLIKNKSGQIAFLDMKIVGNMERATTLVVMPSESIRFPLAGIGTLGSVSTGTQWCNRRVGWKDAKTTPIAPAIIPTYDTTIIKAMIYDMGGGKVGIQSFLEKPNSMAPAHFN